MSSESSARTHSAVAGRFRRWSSEKSKAIRPRLGGESDVDVGASGGHGGGVPLRTLGARRVLTRGAAVGDRPDLALVRDGRVGAGGAGEEDHDVAGGALGQGRAQG